MTIDTVLQVIQTASVSIAIIFTVIVLFIALRSGVLRAIRFGSFEIVASKQEREQARALINAVAIPAEQKDIPFETEQLAQYYAQVLAQSKVSFWFSLIFASLGFFVIIASAFLYSGANSGATIVQFIAGLVMDAVAALFFVQSKRAQESMGKFFGDLRKDRLQVESRKLSESINNPEAKDALRIQLALHYAEIAKPDEVSIPIIQLLSQRQSNAGVKQPDHESSPES